MDYKEPEGTETALFHAMTDPEYQRNWMRCWRAPIRPLPALSRKTAVVDVPF